MESGFPCDACRCCTFVPFLCLPFSRLGRLRRTNNRQAGFRKLITDSQYGIARWHASFNGRIQHISKNVTADVAQANMKPPYPPAVWALGGPPVKKIDVPAQTIFMVLFMVGAAVHMKIFQKNRKRGHKFLFNLFVFSMDSLDFIAMAIANIDHSILRITDSHVNTSNRVNCTLPEHQTCHRSIHLRRCWRPNPVHHQSGIRYASCPFIASDTRMAPCVWHYF